jgi:hypothetical protein
VVIEKALQNICLFFTNLFRVGNFKYLPFEFLSIGVDFTFLCEELELKLEVTELYTHMLNTMVNQLY